CAFPRHEGAAQVTTAALGTEASDLQGTTHAEPAVLWDHMQASVALKTSAAVERATGAVDDRVATIGPAVVRGGRRHALGGGALRRVLRRIGVRGVVTLLWRIARLRIITLLRRVALLRRVTLLRRVALLR